MAINVLVFITLHFNIYISRSAYYVLLAFFLANEYIRAMGRPGLADLGEVGEVYRPIADIAERYIEVAAGNRDVDGLADAIAINGQK